MRLSIPFLLRRPASPTIMRYIIVFPFHTLSPASPRLPVVSPTRRILLERGVTACKEDEMMDTHVQVLIYTS